MLDDIAWLYDCVIVSDCITRARPLMTDFSCCFRRDLGYGCVFSFFVHILSLITITIIRRNETGK